MTPQRIQLSRRKGWRMPPNTVNVARTSKWGNPFVVADYGRELAVGLHRAWIEYGHTAPYPREGESVRLSELRERLLDDAHELRGKDLACWCKPGDLCHADVLLELANKQEDA